MKADRLATERARRRGASRRRAQSAPLRARRASALAALVVVVAALVAALLSTGSQRGGRGASSSRRNRAAQRHAGRPGAASSPSRAGSGATGGPSRAHPGAPVVPRRSEGGNGGTKATPSAAAEAEQSSVPTALGRMVGQMIVASFAGTAPPASLLHSIELGRVGGVILFAENVQSEAQARRLTDRLQRAASAGDNPRLLIMTDQEGGEVKRLPWAPPALAPAEMSSRAIAAAEGRATGRALRAAGVNVDLAPVADVIGVPESFLGTRSFGSDPIVVESRACAFADGLATTGIAFTLKHFPGLGRALTSTDVQSTTVEASAAQLHRDYGAYRGCGARERAIVMVGSAIYPSVTGDTPAVLSREVYATELPYAVGGQEPLTISDNLEAPALADEPKVAARAAVAGLDLLMYASAEAGAAAGYDELLLAARDGDLARRRIEAANEAIAKLKRAIE